MFSGLYSGHSAHIVYGLYRGINAQILVASAALHNVWWPLHVPLCTVVYWPLQGPLCTFVYGLYRGLYAQFMVASTGAAMDNV